VQHRQRGRKLLPDPDGQKFGGRVAEAFDIIEEVVIEPGDDRVHRALQIGEVDDPARLRVDLPANRHFSPERMSVHPPALVSVGHIRQEMSRLEAEVLDEID